MVEPEDGEVTPEGDMLGEALELGEDALGLVLGDVMLGDDVLLGDVLLGDVVLAAASLLVDGVVEVDGDVEVDGVLEAEGVVEVDGVVADGSPTLPLDVVVVLAPVLFFDVSLCVVLDCPVLGWLVVTCAAAGIANAASIAAASVYRCVMVSVSPACWGRPPVLRRIHQHPADTVHV